MLLHRFSSPVALWFVFFVNGAVLSSWAPRIPEVKDDLALTDGALGIALLGIALGAVPAMLITGRVLRNARDVTVCAVAALAFPSALPLIGFATGLATLMAVLLLLGVLSGVLDVAMNTAAMRVQAVEQKRIIGTLHGAYSIGVMAGAGTAAWAVHLKADLTAHFLASSACLLVLGAVAAAVLVASTSHSREDARQSQTTAPMAPTDKPRSRGGWVPITVAVLALSGFLLEGMVTDWSSLLLQRDMGADPAFAASALTVFSAAMFLSRTASDMLSRYIPDGIFVVVAAGAVAVPTAAAIMVESPGVALVAVILIGLCAGPMFPLALTRAAHARPHEVAGVSARLSVIGYAAYLAGPPVIGVAAEYTGLPATFLGVTVVTAVCLLGTAFVWRRHSRHHRSVL